MFEGRILPIILQIAIPILIGNVFNYAYLVTDTFFISRLDLSSSAPISGTGLLYPVFFAYMSIASSLAVGFNIITGRMIGEKKFEQCKCFGISGVILALVLWVPIAILAYGFGTQLIHALAGNNLSPEAIKYSIHYLYSLVPGLLFMVLTQVYGGILLGQGLAYITAVAFMSMTIINIILDPILMFVCNMGVAGAGIATSVSLLLALLFIIKFICSGKSRIPFTLKISNFNGAVLKEIILIGMPQFLMTVSFYLITAVYNKIITQNFNEVVMNAWTLTTRMDEFLIIPITAIGGATTAFAAQNYGRKNIERIREALKLNVKFVFLLCTGMAIVYVIIARFLFKGFSDIPEVAELATRQVYITAFTYGFVAITWIVGTFFQATGKSLPAVILLYARVAVIFASGLIMIYVSKTGVNSIYISMLIGNVVVAPFSYIYINRYLKNIRFKSVVEN